MSNSPQNFSIQNLGAAEINSPLHKSQGFIDPQEKILLHLRLNAYSQDNLQSLKKNSFEKSGPRKKIFFNPNTTKVAVVTCGGLCPGLNSVIRSIVRQLWNRYEVKNIIGIRYGYQGLSNHSYRPITLNPDVVQDIHLLGGSILGSSRGNPKVQEMVDNLIKNNINILFTAGGDGTMRGALAITKEIQRRNLKISVIGVPKTIDNDIPYVMRSFGFETAVEKSCDAVMAAYEEARGYYRGVGLVKLMGRQTGFLAAHATMSTGVVNLCLIPEANFSLSGKNGIIPYLEACFEKKGYAVIVAAEGSGQKLFPEKNTQKTDASGNLVLPDVGALLQKEIKNHFQKTKNPVTLKYIDPSYIVRSSRPNSFDRVFCSRLAQNAVHAAMTGKTAMLIGYWHGVMTHVPFHTLNGKTKKINTAGSLWFNVLENTNQSIAR